MSNDSINAYKVVVLDNKVQYYSSSNVSGGGGYVTSYGGVLYGTMREVITEVGHHSKQDIWVKVLSTGEEKEINLNDTILPVRVGHELFVVFDDKSNRWERLVNDTTKEFSYGNGISNPKSIKNLSTGISNYLLGIGLFIPLVNFLIGIIALVSVFTAPANAAGMKVTNVAMRVVTALCTGLGLFLLGYVSSEFFVMNPEKYSILLKLSTLIGVFFSFMYFTKSFGDLYRIPANMIKDRAELLDKKVINREA